MVHRCTSRLRDAVREWGNKICLERSAAKTLLTLHRHTSKSQRGTCSCQSTFGAHPRVSHEQHERRRTCVKRGVP